MPADSGQDSAESPLSRHNSARPDVAKAIISQARPQPVLHGVQPWQRASVAAAAVRAWARWGATFGTAASLRFARTAHGLAAAGCDWAPAAAEQLAAASGPGLVLLPQAPVMLVRDALCATASFWVAMQRSLA